MSATKSDALVKLINYVQIPSEMFAERLWSLPFSELLAKAQSGVDGLSVLQLPYGVALQRDGGDRVRYSMKHEESNTWQWFDVPAGVAVMRCGAHDKALLYAQAF